MSHDVRAIEENTDNHSHTKCCLIKCFIHVYFFVLLSFSFCGTRFVPTACRIYGLICLWMPDSGLHLVVVNLKLGRRSCRPNVFFPLFVPERRHLRFFLINLRSGFSCVYFPGCRFRLTTPGNPKDSICRKCRMDQTITSPQRNSGFLQIHTLTAFCPREDIDGNRNPGFAGIVRSTVNLRNFRVTNVLDARYVD